MYTKVTNATDLKCTSQLEFYRNFVITMNLQIIRPRAASETSGKYFFSTDLAAVNNIYNICKVLTLDVNRYILIIF